MLNKMTTINNVAPTTLFSPVFINLEQIIVFDCVVTPLVTMCKETESCDECKETESCDEVMLSILRKKSHQ